MQQVSKLCWLLALIFPAAFLQAEEKPAQKIQSLHFAVDIDAVTNGKKQANREELWVKGTNLFRSERAQIGGKKITILLGDILYSYQLGTREGEKSRIPNAATIQQNGLQTFESMKKEKGKKLSVETVEGNVCDKYEYKENGQKGNLWILQTNQLPFKVAFQFKQNSPQGLLEGNMTSIFRNVEINQDIPDYLFVLPTNVTFRDVGPPSR